MDEVASEVVERLRRSRSLRWLRAIDAADLDTGVEAEPDPEAVVTPYRWLLHRVGDGVKLTQAGYLPPAVVRDAMNELDWARNWPGKPSREDATRPVLFLRESAQRFGLVRKSRGRLLPTKAGRALADDPVQLWWYLAERLPDARHQAEHHAGVLYLITVAARLPEDDELLAEGMAILGWSEGDIYHPLSPSAAFIAARETWAVFDRLGLLGDSLWRFEATPSAAGRRLARAALIGRDPSAAPPPRPRQRAGGSAVQLHVALRDTDVWRRLVVPGSLTLRELHDVLLTAMGWLGYHLHMFDVGGVLYGDIDDFDGPLGDEDTVTVAQAAGETSRFCYEYDFGDGWQHDVTVEQILSSVGADTPRLIDGARACPPEDCGGPEGYLRLLEVLRDPTDDEHDDLLEWLGGPFDPARFDLAECNAAIELVDRHTRRRVT